MNLLLFPDLSGGKRTAPDRPSNSTRCATSDEPEVVRAAPLHEPPNEHTERVATKNARKARYLYLYLPAFALERAGFEATQMAVLVAEQKGAMRLISLTPAAVAEGLRKGMSTAEARAIVPDLALQDHDPEGERSDKQALLDAFACWSDRISSWGDEGLVMEISGTAHLFGGERGVLELVANRALELGHVARAVIGDDPRVVAAIASCASEHIIVPPGQSRAALAPLPISLLDPTEALARSLAAIGVVRIDQWAGLDAASVAGRYGAEGVLLHRVARGLAVSRLPWQCVDLEPVSERVVLGGPSITLEPVYFVLPGLLERVSQRLFERDAMAVRLALHFVLERGPAHVVRVRVGRATRDRERLDKVVRARLERVRLEAPVVELLLEVEEQIAEQTWQPGLIDRVEASEQLPDLLARLSDTLGESALFSPLPRSSWRPELAWGPRCFEPGQPLPTRSTHRKADLDPVAEQRQHEQAGPRPRPTLMLCRPERVEVRDTDGRPYRLRIEGRWYSLDRVAGPERLDGEWWGADCGFSRDYWVVGIIERVGWCFRDDTGAWWWHGWFD
ncbi:MAG: protein ImuB [Kiritimatiellia bacterium]